jgi:hypothetical protein
MELHYLNKKRLFIQALFDKLQSNNGTILESKINLGTFYNKLSMKNATGKKNVMERQKLIQKLNEMLLQEMPQHRCDAEHFSEDIASQRRCCEV